MSSSNGRLWATWTRNRFTFPSATAVVVVGVVLASACSDTPTAVKQTDTLDGEAVLLSAQVTSDIRQFTPKGTIITHDMRVVNSIEKGGELGWQASGQADSQAPARVLVGAGPQAVHTSDDHSTAILPKSPATGVRSL